MAKLTERIAAIWALAGGVLILSIMIVTSVNGGAFALDRLARLAGSTIAALPGYEDYVRLTISSAAPMFLPYCQLHRGHVVVDLFVQAFPALLRATLDRAWLAATAALALFLAYWMTVGMVETRADNAMSPILGWPEWPFYLPGIVSLILWAVVATAQAAGEAGRNA